jgi:hypothetical protein
MKVGENFMTSSEQFTGLGGWRIVAALHYGTSQSLYE